jgi:hypothetical protein
MMQTDAQRMQYSKTQKKLIANQFSRSKVIDCVGELLTMRWNAWHSERHCVFTAGGEKVKRRDKEESKIRLRLSNFRLEY